MASRLHEQLIINPGLPLVARREEKPESVPHGHITSLSVMRECRRLGIAEKLMTQSRK